MINLEDFKLNEDEKYDKIKIYNNESGETLKIKFRDIEHKEISEIVYSNDYGYHRSGNKPALIKYHRDNIISCEAYYINGRLHRDNDEPSMICYNLDGTMDVEFYHVDGLRGRTKDGLAKSSYIYGLRSCVIKEYILDRSEALNITSRISYDKEGQIVYKHIFKGHSLNSNNDEPSIKEYYVNGNVELEKYHKVGMLHRSNGKPASIKYNMEGEIVSEKYYLYGIEYDEFEYLVKLGEKSDN